MQFSPLGEPVVPSLDVSVPLSKDSNRRHAAQIGPDNCTRNAHEGIVSSGTLTTPNFSFGRAPGDTKNESERSVEISTCFITDKSDKSSPRGPGVLPFSSFYPRPVTPNILEPCGGSSQSLNNEPSSEAVHSGTSEQHEVKSTSVSVLRGLNTKGTRISPDFGDSYTENKQTGPPASAITQTERNVTPTNADNPSPAAATNLTRDNTEKTAIHTTASEPTEGPSSRAPVQSATVTRTYSRDHGGSEHDSSDSRPSRQQQAVEDTRRTADSNMVYRGPEESPHRSSRPDKIRRNPSSEKMDLSDSVLGGSEPPSGEGTSGQGRREGEYDRLDIWRTTGERSTSPDASAWMGSPLRMVASDDSEETGGELGSQVGNIGVIGTPGTPLTISTAPSTDEASIIDDLTLGNDNLSLGQPVSLDTGPSTPTKRESEALDTVDAALYSTGSIGRYFGQQDRTERIDDRTHTVSSISQPKYPWTAPLSTVGEDASTSETILSASRAALGDSYVHERQEGWDAWQPYPFQATSSTPQPKPSHRIQMHRRTKSWEERPDQGMTGRMASTTSFHRSNSAMGTAERTLSSDPHGAYTGRGTMPLTTAYQSSSKPGPFHQQQQFQWTPNHHHPSAQARSPGHQPQQHTQVLSFLGSSPRSLEEDGTSPLSSPSMSPRMMPLPQGGETIRAGTPASPSSSLNVHAPRFAVFRGDSGLGYASSHQEHSPLYRGFLPESHVASQQAHHYVQQHPQYMSGSATGSPTHHQQQHHGPAYRPSTYNPLQHGAAPHHMAYSPVSSPGQVSGAHVRHPQGQRPHPLHRQGSSTLTAGPGSQLTPNPSRSSPEILKTLLRKKACLYEPDTSQAVALVTWLVGRQLALKLGYFSRQQLQSGVHACVASKIDSGVITRTKVNRCMQIILNSCFHYIIPRPDGSEEKGDAFREVFKGQAVDDSDLLQVLPSPWNDMVVDADAISGVEEGKSDDEEEETVDSPRSEKRSVSSRKEGSSREGGKSQSRGSGGKTGGTSSFQGSKRAVLLCFNENVRSAEDVFRCHNEFIRDAAIASNLVLSAQDWRAFFGENVAFAGDSGERIPPLTLPGVVGQYSARQSTSRGRGGQGASAEYTSSDADALGEMSPAELRKFRTTWCAKRYDHDPYLCAFAHIDVNGGWLRRDPSVHNYGDEFCPDIVSVLDGQNHREVFTFNTCPKGVSCECAHSREEVEYHPAKYKTRVCPSAPPRGGGLSWRCPLRDICPRSHPSSAARQLKQQFGEAHAPSSQAQHSIRQHRQYSKGPAGTATTYYGMSPLGRAGPASSGKVSSGPGGSGGMPDVPKGAPMLYVNPAPESEFEKYLMLPGLRDLFRRQSSVLRAHTRGANQSDIRYSNFGDDWGISVRGDQKDSPR